jgi:type I restriction enzyme, S subunit
VALKSIPIIEDINFSVIHEAEKIKIQKTAEAQNLLDSIDNYLLEELGITLPMHTNIKKDEISAWMNKDNPLVKNRRLFLTKYSEIEGKRWDTFEITNRNKKIEGGTYPNKKMKLIANLIKGQSITFDKIIAGKYPVIAGGQTSPYNHNQYNFNGNVITISASGAYSGFIWYHDYPIFASDCTVVYAKDENEISTLFLSVVLKLKQKEIYNLQQGAGQPHVYSRDLAELNIPVPPITKQQDMIAHISNIKAKAKQLIIESKNVLDSAKSEIEKLILEN